MPLADGTTFAGYTVIRLLGSGGMGEVYLARHPRLSRNDALKVLPRELAEDPDYRLRFEREADAAAGLFHPHVVGVHDRGECDGQLWISMDFVEGSDALKLLQQHFRGGMPCNEVSEIATAVADALDHAHSHGLLHRDVKPANILITDLGSARRRIMLADFGIARRMDETNGLTATNMTVGTLSYCAPEQLTGQPIDGRADQYALGATVFQLLTGTVPHEHSNPAVVIGRRLSEPTPRISDTRPDLADLDAVIARGLAVRPGDRFSSCGEFAAALVRQRPAAPVRFPAPPAPATLAAFAPTPSPPPPAPTPHPNRPQPMVWALAGLGVLAAVAVVLVAMLMAQGSTPTRTTAAGEGSTSSPLNAPSVPATRYSAPPIPTSSATAERPNLVLPDADDFGFITYNGGARCAGADRAVMILRTTQSAVVICRNTTRGLYYRGYRISDGASIELGDVIAMGSGYRAVNSPEGAFYEVSTGGLVISQNGEILADEPALESAS